MLCKIYFLLFLIGFFGSVLSIFRSLLTEEKSNILSHWNWTWLDSLGPFLVFTSFVGLVFVHFKSFSTLVNVPVSLSIGLFITYYAQVFFRNSGIERHRGSYL